jgi:hypothetical protein
MPDIRPERLTIYQSERKSVVSRRPIWAEMTSALNTGMALAGPGDERNFTHDQSEELCWMGLRNSHGQKRNVRTNTGSILAPTSIAKSAQLHFMRMNSIRRAN